MSANKVYVIDRTDFIKDTDDVWVQCSHGENDKKIVYQSKQMSGLFKEVYPDGTVVYHNIDEEYKKEERTDE